MENTTAKYPIRLVCFMGRPGSGKNTLAERLAEDYPDEVAVIDPGQLIRDSEDPAHEYHERLAKPRVIAYQGRLPEDAVEVTPINAVLREELRRHIERCKTIVCMTGFPRTQTQLDELGDWVREYNEHGMRLESHIFHLLLPANLGRRRIKGRQLSSNGPAREDDSEEKWQKRWRGYARLTRPMLSQLSEENRLILIDGTREVEAVYQDVRHILQLPNPNRERDDGEPPSEFHSELKVQ